MKVYTKFKSSLVIVSALLMGVITLLSSCAKTYTYQATETFNVYEGISKSQITFHGKVTDVKYRMSKEGLPHTFVTYKISKVLYGKSEGDKKGYITLRFLGGQYGDGSFLLPSLIPHFNIGNEDVLLVVGNGVSECPLVRCKEGRIRVYEDLAFANSGQPITGFDKGRVITEGKMEPTLRVFSYPRPDFHKLYQRKEYREFLKEKGVDIDEKSLREMYEKNLPEQLTFRYVQHVGTGMDSSKTGKPPINLPRREMLDVAKRQLHLTDLLRMLGNNVMASEYRQTPASNLDPNKTFDSKL